MAVAKKFTGARLRSANNQLLEVPLYTDELETHFKIEEETLLPLLTSPDTQILVQRTLLEHQMLRKLLEGLQQNDVEALNNFGKYLSAHVRFEERALFPVLENFLQ